jgi:predicted ArsR family transcriptional regulator
VAQLAFSATTQEAANQLRISDATLRKLRREGVLKAGVHFRAMGMGKSRPPLLWNVEAADQALAHWARRALTA